MRRAGGHRPAGAAWRALIGLVAVTAPGCARAVVPAQDSGGNLPGTDAVGPGNDAVPNGLDSGGGPTGSDSFVPTGTDAAPPGTDAYSGPVWVPPVGDGAACAPGACPADAIQCVGPDADNAYCRAFCDETLVPDPCAPDYDCVALFMGGGACLPAAARYGCCTQCGCGPSDICVSVDSASPVCLEQCAPATPTTCGPGEGCITITGMMPGLGGACLPTPTPTCSGVIGMEAMCI